jgi:hypothetical protein
MVPNSSRVAKRGSFFCKTYKILHRKQGKTWITVQEFITLPPENKIS